MVISLIQGALGNPFGNAASGPAFGLLNEVLGEYRSRDGIARPSRYEVVVGSPPLLATDNKNARNVSLKCESIVFPGRNIDTTTDTNIYGPTREIASGFSFADLTATFQCSSDMSEKIYFEDWQQSSFDRKSFAMRFYKQYTGELRIYLLDEQNQRRYGVKVWECFPKNIAEQNLNYGTINEQLKLSVTFSYRYWEDITTGGEIREPLGDRIVQTVSNQAFRRLNAQRPAVHRLLGNILR